MHKLLARQLRRKAGIASDAELAGAFAGFAAAADDRSAAARLAQALPALLTEVENTYHQFDRDLELRRRSLEVSSQELLHLNNQLRAEAASRQRALDSLREAANRLLRGAGLPVLREDAPNLEALSSLMAQLAREREATQHELALSEERLVLALNVTGSVAWDWDITRNKLVVISSGDEVLGFPRQRIEQDPPRIGRLMDRADGMRFRDTLVEHLRGHSPEFRCGVWMTLRKRVRCYMELHGKVVARDAAGRATRMAGIMHDLTANKKTEDALRQSEARFRSLTELSSDWYWEQDDQFRFITTRGESDARAGIIADEYNQRTWWDLAHTCPVGFTWDEYRALLARREAFRDLVLRREMPGEAPRFACIAGAPIFSVRGKFMGYRGVARDVTERVRGEAALRESQVAAEEATRAKSQFLANMSHEIRTPMNGVLGMTELLLGTPLNARQRQFAETARRSGEALLALINDILDFSKIEAGKMAIEQVEFVLRDVLDDVTQILAESAAAKGIELVCRLPPAVPHAVIGDPSRLRQILINLIGNAIKFTERGDVVTDVRVDDTGAGSPMLHFAVRDTGIGIAREAQATIFQAFNQADGSTTRHYGGTGLGLAICRQLVGLMGGEIALDSEPGSGSTFQFSVPLRYATPGAAQQALPPQADRLRGKRLLVVDDNAAFLDAVRDMAESGFGMRCSVAASGVSALRMAREAVAQGDAFAAALLDAGMPGLGGIALGEAIGADDALATLRLVLAAPLDRAADADQARAAGFVAALTKPLRRNELLRALLLALGTAPCDVSQAMAAAKRAPKPPAGALRGRILVAEDYPVNQQVIRAVLETLGCSVTMVNNGREAVQALQRAPFDLVLMDCQMPEMDGYMATRAIRALELDGGGARRTPIVALTAHATQADRERCLNAGMDSYVSKPFTQAVLLRELQCWLPQAGGGDELHAEAPAAMDTQRLDFRALNELRLLESDAQGTQLRGFVDTYLVHTAAQLGRISAAIDAVDLAEVAQQAHQLKSGSLTIGAMRVGKLAHALEQESLGGRAARCQALLAEIDKEFALAEKLLRAQTGSARAAA